MNERKRIRNKRESKDMPYYQWKDKLSDKTVDVRRAVKEIDRAPDKDEALEAGLTIEEFAEADWTREISTQGATHGFGQKGRW